MFEIIILPRPDRQSFAAGKSRFKSLLEFCRSVGTFNHDQIIILPLRPDAEKFAAPVRSNRPSIW
jgi:hypothetical protein